MRIFYYLDTDFLNKPSEEIINGLITLFKHIKDKENITIIYSKKEMKGKLVKFLKSSEIVYYFYRTSILFLYFLRSIEILYYFYRNSIIFI